MVGPLSLGIVEPHCGASPQSRNATSFCGVIGRSCFGLDGGQEEHPGVPGIYSFISYDKEQLKICKI